MPRSTPVEFPPDFLELLLCFSKARCRYLIVGAHALAVAGRPRFTQDLDILVKPTAQNAKRVGMALAIFGFAEHREVVAREFATTKRMVTLGIPPLQVDIMTSVTGVSFDRAWRGRRTVRIGHLRVPFLGIRELIANKLSTDRPKDRIDAAELRDVLKTPQNSAKRRRQQR